MPNEHDNNHHGDGSGLHPELPSYITELPQARPHIHETRVFPEGFLWGTATSSHQVEGGNDKNDWWEWEQQGRVMDQQVSGNACDHYCRYEDDFDLAAEMGNNAHRLSIEWSRIEPVEGEFNLDEIMHYRRVLEALKKRGLKTMVTLWHFTLPTWFAEQGGWLSPKAVRRFERYAEFIARELGDQVDIWNTINEPMIYLGQTYGTGAWPPGEKSSWKFFRAFQRLVKSHRVAYKKLHEVLDTETSKIQVGIAKNVVTFEPYRQHSEIDSLFIRLMDRLFNHQFFVWTRGHHDFIGINYYFHYRVKTRPSKASQFFFEVHTENREVSDLGWEIHPPGIFEALMAFTRYNLPIYITENGLASADDGKRPRFMVSMLKEVYHAIKAGADVRGYFHWSLLDNFEWEKGFAGRFGLMAIDFENQKRTPRRSYFVYQDVCQNNGLRHDLLKFMGHGVRW